CALGHKACRDDRSVLYYRVPRLLDALALARGDGRYSRLLKSLARVELLIIDDWGLAPFTSQQGRDLLDIVDDRHGRGSTIVTSQIPVKHWHELIADPTIADAVLDRLVHTAHRWISTGPRCAIPRQGRRPHPSRRRSSENSPPSLRREQKNEQCSVHYAPPPWANRGPPTRVAAFDSWRSLRDAHGSLLFATGTVPCLRKPKKS